MCIGESSATEKESACGKAEQSHGQNDCMGVKLHNVNPYLSFHYYVYEENRSAIPDKNVKMPKKHDKNMSIFDFIAKT